MLRRAGAVVAALLVLLPIGGVLIVPQAVTPSASAQVTSVASAGSGSSVPEPTAAAVVCLGAVGMLTRRAMRRRTR